MEIEQLGSHTDAELLAERQFDCAYAEADINGAAIDWRYWVEKLPMLSVGQAARLMKGLEPMVFADLNARPTKEDPTELCKQAFMLEQLAIAQGKTTDTPHGWLAWVMQHRFNIHPAFRDEVNAKPLTAPAQTPATTDPAPEEPITPAKAVPEVQPTPEQTAQTPAPDTGSDNKRGARKPTIESVSFDYMRKEYRAGQFKSAAAFHKHLCTLAGKGESPFEMGTGTNARKLFCPGASTFFDVGTLGKMWKKIRAA